MNEINQQRKSIVKALIRSLRDSREAEKCQDFPPFDINLAFNLHGENGCEEIEQAEKCIITGLCFRGNLAADLITWSDYGAVWMGLWLDEQVKLDDHPGDEGDGEEDKWFLYKTGDGNTLFPRWLAEAINEECGNEVIIQESNIYET